MQYKKEFEAFQCLSFSGRKKLVLELLTKIKHTSKTLENIFIYIAHCQSVTEAELQETFIGILSGIKTVHEAEQQNVNVQMEYINKLLKQRKIIEDEEDKKDRQIAENSLYQLSL
ncbi:MAG: hypothetical protein PHH70_03135 [Candidatus Gracilibacteria bacterium]|nr:hypothetical protein [Candidatus Gracilibacteria bacterium]